MLIYLFVGSSVRHGVTLDRRRRVRTSFPSTEDPDHYHTLSVAFNYCLVPWGRDHDSRKFVVKLPNMGRARAGVEEVRGVIHVVGISPHLLSASPTWHILCLANAILWAVYVTLKSERSRNHACIVSINI